MDISAHTFDEILGHADLRDALTQMDANGRVPGGLLLHGGDGRGKRTLALAFARMRLTPAGEGPDLRDTPSDLTLVERPEGTRQHSIDSIRALRDSFSLTPAEAPGRVAVILDADQLTEEAGNALLKLLEEPPPHALLILTAPSRETVMETLVSRCHAYRVGPLSQADLQTFMARQEREHELVQVVLRLAEGSPGRALSLLDHFESADDLAALGRLLRTRGTGFTLAMELTAMLKERGSRLEEAREEMRGLLGNLIGILRLALRARLGVTAAEAALNALPDTLAEPLGTRTPLQLREALESCLEVLSDLDRNVNLELLLQDFSAQVAES